MAQEHELQKLRKSLKKVKKTDSTRDLSRSPSINLISSDESILSDKVQKKSKSKRKRNSSSSSSSDSDKEKGKHVNRK